jgi:hypothetical protein
MRIVYLLKNGCQIDEVNKDEENPEEYALRRRKKEIEIENLQKQLRSRLPSGRDLQHKFCNWALEATEYMGRLGFEPRTNRLKAEYSTVELATLKDLEHYPLDSTNINHSTTL